MVKSVWGSPPEPGVVGKCGGLNCGFLCYLDWGSESVEC